MEKEVLSILEFCERTGLSEYTVRRLIKEGMAATFYCGNKVYLHYSKTLEKMFTENKTSD